MDFGLTSGLHSLDPDEIAHWLERVHAGNLYVNRGITGAIVRRQPFGGWKRSVVGPTTKAGGPHYLHGLVDWVDAPSSTSESPAADRAGEGTAAGTPAAAERSWLDAARALDERAWAATFGETVKKSART